MTNFEIFVVPNPAFPLSSAWNADKMKEKLGDFSAEEMMVQLWWYNPTDSNGVDNTVCHYGDDHEIISEYVPSSWISDLKEGESKVLTFNGGKVIVTANQRGYRYRRFGAFEDVVAMVTAS